MWRQGRTQRPAMLNLARYRRAFFSLLVILFITSFNLLSLLMLSSKVNAVGTLASRKITLGSSKISTSNTYSVSFIPGSTTTIRSIVVDFANSTCGPLIGTACVTGNHPVTGITTSASVSVTQSGTSGSPWSFTATTPHANIGNGKALVIQLAGGTGALSTSVPVTFSFTATNPS